MDTAATAPRLPLAGRSLNDLPRPLLLNVLSHMDARQLVQTCQLSRLWRNLWRDVPCINAWRLDIGSHGNLLFKKFVTRLLMLRNPVALDKFELWHYNSSSQLEADTADANLWIHHALLCNARSVDVLVYGNLLELHHAAFTSEHLTTLRLRCCVLAPGFFGHLKTGCKVLECLIIEECTIRDTDISSQTLKILSIDVFSSFTSGAQASISIPSLVCFTFADRPHNRLPLLANMGSLATACATVGYQGTGTQVDDVSQFLRGLSAATKLEFNLVYAKLKMESNLQWCPTFNNLKFLTLGEWCLHADFYPLIIFLQNSPNLKNLTLNLRKHPEVPGRVRGKLQEISFTCEQLEIVEIICSERTYTVDSLQQFLVASGITSQIEIRIDNDRSRQPDMSFGALTGLLIP